MPRKIWDPRVEAAVSRFAPGTVPAFGRTADLLAWCSKR